MKEIFTTTVAAVAAMSLFLAGCGDVGEDSENESKNFAPESALAKNCAAMLDSQMDALEKGLEAASRYVDFGNENVRSAVSGEIGLERLSALIPEDISKFKRVRDSASRSAIDGEDEYITLEEELDEIAKKFESEFEGLLPDPTSALSLDYVSGTETGILIGDDMEIPYNSVEGAFTVNVLNAVANGEDVESAVQEIEKYIEGNYETDEGENSRGVWKCETGTWAKGVVNYKWGNISDTHKQAVLDAMRLWESKTENRVSFREFSDSKFNNFLLRLNLIGRVEIYDTNLNGSNGLTTVGYVGGKTCKMRIKTGISGDDLKRTAAHELGHALGLKHEHQRYDRDDYLIVPDSKKGNSNYEKIPKEESGFRWDSRRIRIGYWKVKIYYPVWWTKRYSHVEGEFDFHSVMLYSPIPVRPNKRYLNNGKEFTECNIEPSETDVRAIRRMY